MNQEAFERKNDQPPARAHRSVAANKANKKEIHTAVENRDRQDTNRVDLKPAAIISAETRNCVVLHSFEGIDLDKITSVTPRQDYAGLQSEELLDYGVAAVKIAKLGGRFSRPVFLELDKRFNAGKKVKDYFLGFKSIDALCKHIGISRKHFYNVINDNRSGRKLLSPAEQTAKDEAKEEARVEREEARADREAKRRAEKERLKQQAEELRAARENNKKLQQSLDKKDEAVAQAKQEGAQDEINKVATAAAQKHSEKGPEGFSPEPKTARDLYYFTIGAQSVKGVSLGSPRSIVKIIFQLLDGQIEQQKLEATVILQGLKLGIEERIQKLTPANDPHPQSVKGYDKKLAAEKSA